MEIPITVDFNKFGKYQKLIFYLVTSLLILFTGWAYKQGYIFLAAFPLVLIILLLCIFRLDLVAMLIVFITPISINLAQTSLGIGVSLPSEPMMFLLFIIFWLKIWADGGLDPKILKHPITLLIFMHLIWYVVTTATSTMFIVSFKSTLARFTYITVFYFMMIYLFSKFENISRFLWVYMIPLVAVIFYTLSNQIAHGMTEDAAHVAMTPYYNDHTAYGAAICFYIPVLFSMIGDNSKTKTFRFFSFLVLLILSAGVIFSYTRASWIGLIAAFLCYLAMISKIKTWLVYSGLIALIVIITFNWTYISMKLERNDEVSSTDFSSHVQSIGNISTDDSNVERLNRWASAWRMFIKKPIVGFGPGTYMFNYAPFQKYSERSGISTNFGTGGGSHSEYLGPLSEQGIAGPLIFVLMIAVLIHRATALIRKTKDKKIRNLARGILLGLITYFVQGLFNYFLDTEKLSVPFWGFIAAIVALEIFHDNQGTKKLSAYTAT